VVETVTNQIENGVSFCMTLFQREQSAKTKKEVPTPAIMILLVSSSLLLVRPLLVRYFTLPNFGVITKPLVVIGTQEQTVDPLFVR